MADAVTTDADTEGRTATPAYDALHALHARVDRLSHLQAIAGWDQAALMPAGGAAARADALAEIATTIHGLLTAPEVGGWIERAADEPLDDWQRANLREIAHGHRLAVALPAELVRRRELLTSACEHAWRTQRPANDWAGFAANLRPVVEVAREEGERLGQALGCSAHEALLQRFEPGMTLARVDALFDELRGWLPGLVAEALERQSRDDARAPPLAPAGPFDVARQHALGQAVARRLGFDFERGRLDTSTHPFSGGVPDDVRMTTRYREGDMIDALYATIHETGHSLYEQNRPRPWLGQPVSEARSMAIHESQSLAFEMQLGRHPGFVATLAPMLAEAFGAQPAFEPARLAAALVRVAPGKIRVDADEATYPAHVALRHDIERGIIGGGMQVDDIPDAWDAGMRAWLGIDTRGDFRDGPMQDIHWPSGIFGYFPCYTLGAMYAAQWFEAIRARHPDLDARLGDGDIAPVVDWMRDNVWRQASRWTTDELAVRASGRVLDAGALRRHLHRRCIERAG